MRGIENRRQSRLSASERVEVDDAGVGRTRLLVHEVLRGIRRDLSGDRARRGGELRQPTVDEAPLERRDERDPDDGERPGHDDGERQCEAGTDAPERVHARAR